MAEIARRNKNECLQVGARIITKACQVTYHLECSRRYSLASKRKL